MPFGVDDVLRVCVYVESGGGPGQFVAACMPTRKRNLASSEMKWVRALAGNCSAHRSRWP